MKEIDIRGNTVEENDVRIRFGDADSDVIDFTLGTPTIFIASDDNGEVEAKDIDNLILALKKAKELLSKD